MKPILVFQTDFTYKEGAVSSMYGVVKTVDRELEIMDGTHELPQYDTWSASYRLYQSLQFSQRERSTYPWLIRESEQAVEHAWRKQWTDTTL